MKKKIGFLESNLSGSGFKGLEFAKEMGYYVTFFTRDLDRYLKISGAKSYFDQYVDEVIYCETNKSQSVISIIQQNNFEFSAFLTLGEYDVNVCAEVAKHLGLPGLNPIAALNARNKYLTRLACEKKGIASPLFKLVQTEDDIKKAIQLIGLPCIVKPTDETSSADVLKCYSLKEVINQVQIISNKKINTRGQKRFEGVLIEELIVGYEVSVETITFNNQTYILGVTDKFTSKDHFVEIGHNFPSSLPENIIEDCSDLARKSLKAIDFDFGVAHIEMKITSKGPKLIEINARPAGGKITDLVEHVNGFSYIKEFIRMAIGFPPQLEIDKNKHSGAAIRFLIASEGRVTSVQGLNTLSNNPNIKEIHIPDLNGMYIKDTKRNSDRLGYIITTGINGFEAGRQAESALEQISIVLETVESSSLTKEEEIIC
jgi:biotin carboxylase